MILLIDQKQPSWIILLIFILCLTSCNTNRTNQGTINFRDFPATIVPTSTKISIDDETAPLVIGKADVIPNGYMIYLYDNDNLIGLTNNSFELIRLTGHKGPGPEEINGVSGKFGQVMDSTGCVVSVFDPYSLSLYSLNTETGTLHKRMRFPDTMSRYRPFDVTQLKNGAYISPRGDFQYGIVSFNPNNNEVIEWPVGLNDIDPIHPLENHVNMRAYDYNERNGIIAEIYGTLPQIIIHNEDGEILRVLTINGMPRKTDKSMDFFETYVLLMILSIYCGEIPMLILQVSY